jgi:hypothetical protein
MAAQCLKKKQSGLPIQNPPEILPDYPEHCSPNVIAAADCRI